MGLNCGIVGLPNVGKTTIFSALTSTPAEAANYPFSTVKPNVGIINLPDERLDKIAAIFKPRKVVPAVVEFVDIAGLPKGASTGEGLGNKFLSHIRQVGVIAHVVRCFENEDVVHVTGELNPLSDIEIVNIELALADLETVENRKERLEKIRKTSDRDALKETKDLIELLEKLKEGLENGIPARLLGLTNEQAALISDLHLITMKKQIYICNVDEGGLKSGSKYIDAVKAHAEKEGAIAIPLCGKLEAEISLFETAEEREEFLKEAGLEESGLIKLMHSGYNLLGLRTYFTAGDPEVRAWTFRDGDKAPKAASVIHTDFEKGFIRAEVYHYDDLMKYGTEQKIKEAGKFRVEGKEYLVKDGDIMHFRFNV
ncbi:MAG: redox-regulated ATPase YchF [Spirochaetes bacterium]|nr:redox-regulated ATPase YchF [Spirochaetota bacterium]